MPPYTVICPHCGKSFDPCSLVPPHRLVGDWDKRCPGVGAIPRNPIIEKGPLGKDKK